VRVHRFDVQQMVYSWAGRECCDCQWRDGTGVCMRALDIGRVPGLLLMTEQRIDS
jgi:hypothetical protein